MPRFYKYIYSTCPNRMRDPPAKNRPASCINFNPKCGSYSVKRILHEHKFVTFYHNNIGVQIGSLVSVLVARKTEWFFYCNFLVAINANHFLILKSAAINANHFLVLKSAAINANHFLVLKSAAINANHFLILKSAAINANHFLILKTAALVTRKYRVTE